MCREFMKVERYSHVMHIVSQRATASSPRARTLSTRSRACFPAGTLTGAPKIRAMEIIDDLEPVRRGLYGGALGYVDSAREPRLRIAIRTPVLEKAASPRAGRRRDRGRFRSRAEYPETETKAGARDGGRCDCAEEP